MPCERKTRRYGHSEGHTEVCFDDTGKLMVTCGNDGDVRIWENLEDDDPKFIQIGEKVYSVALKNDKLVTASSNNAVQMHTFPDGDPDGILTRFTTNATHVTFNSSGSRVAAGSSDFMVKVVEVSDNRQQKTLRGHEAPVLSVSFDPKDEFLASSSCDGSVVVWNIEDQTQVIRWPLLPKTNSVSNAKSLCRLAWQPRTAKLLAVPVETKVHLYERGSWDHVSTLSDDLLTQPVNVVAWSPCGRFLAASSIGGLLTVWDVNSELCVERVKHEKGFSVCSLAWHPSGGQIAYTDTQGGLCMLDGLGTPSEDSSTNKAPAQKTTKEYDDLFDDDGVTAEGLSAPNSPVRKPITGDNHDHDDDDDDDDDDFLVPATGRVRNRGGILEDENSMDTGSPKLGRDKFAIDDDTSSAGMFAATRLLPLPPVYDGPVPTPPQKAFQPSSTPAHLTHRFMMWNLVGIVRCYNDDQDNAIDVEFHDSAVHHAMHLTNTLGHTLADLSQEAVLLACPSTDELASKLQCLHFSSWDTNKEWMVDLPQGEDARALCLGRGWVAVATSSLLLRLFSIGGVQREMFSLAGPVVCMAAHGQQLLIVYHRAVGFDGEQALGVQLLQLGGRKQQIINSEPLPLSQRSHLSWLGFTAQGTPCYVDSQGVVRMLNRTLGNTWMPVCSTRETCKSKSDHYWVVGVHESPQQLRCIPCKGSRFPPTLPRPAVAILPFKLPLCQATTEKGQMEEQFWRSVFFHSHHSFLSSSGCETDEEAHSQSQKEQQELLMKMFALSCKMGREFRCVELADLMTQNVMTLAIRYASLSRRVALAQRLSEVAQERAEQEQEEEQEEEQQSHCSITPTSGRVGPTGGGPSGRRSSSRNHQEEEEEEQEQEQNGEELTEEENQQETEETTETRKRANQFAKEAFPPARPVLAPLGKVGRANPFKVLDSGKPSSSLGQPRLANILDDMTANRRPAPSAGKPTKGPILKPLAPRPRTKTQSTLLQMMGSNKSRQQDTERAEEPEPDVPPPSAPAENPETKKPKTGFQLWMEENRKSIMADQPDLEETDVIKEAMGRFRTLSPDQRLAWTEKARGQSGDAGDLKKRKRAEMGAGAEVEKDKLEDENCSKKKKLLESSSKLSAFAFSKN